MADLSPFPITKRWPAAHPDRIQLYSLPTPNGVKVSIALEELELPYEPHLIDIGKNAPDTIKHLPENILKAPENIIKSPAAIGKGLEKLFGGGK